MKSDKQILPCVLMWTAVVAALVSCSTDTNSGAPQGSAAAGSSTPAPVAVSETGRIEGVPGSPSATMSIDGKQLPPPQQKFKGKIERNAAQSTPYWPARVVPPTNSPPDALRLYDLLERDTAANDQGRASGLHQLLLLEFRKQPAHRLARRADDLGDLLVG